MEAYTPHSRANISESPQQGLGVINEQMIERKEELNRGGPYCSDTEANGDQSANLKRQKMSEEERLTRW